MFKLGVTDLGFDDQYYEIIFEKDGNIITLSPEYPEEIMNVDLDTENGQFDTRPSNGDFCLKWTSEKITFVVARHGDGQGGSIVVQLTSTHELLDNLKTVLKELQKHMSERYGDKGTHGF